MNNNVAAPQLSWARDFGIFGWNYNRANYKYDTGLRWQRYTCGRKMACAQVGMFREDITDLANVTMCKLKVYGPIYGIVITVCVTVLVEGRSGLKFPGPPVFISAIYLQCLCIGFAFMCLATWLLFHATMRAQVACVQLRTRLVRLPVPTQRQLDSSRKIMSTYEEQGLYDMFRFPFLMPNGSTSPHWSEDEEEEDESVDKKAHTKGYNKAGVPGVAAKVKSKVMEKHNKGATTHNARMPGLTPGNPSWYTEEMEDRTRVPEASPSACGKVGQVEPFQHFELLRNAQKEWWGCEAYMRVCFLFGMMHLVMAFSYWITLHNIAELGMIWCSNLGAAGLTAGVWIIFRLDVLPEHGGCLPIEIGGPFVTSVALGLMYSHTVTQTMMDIARGVAILIILMHITLVFRMYSVAKPTGGKAHHQAGESGGRLFNESAACSNPSWLPSAFQHVMYLVAPPKTKEQLEKEQQDRDQNALGEDPMAKVDMTPWYYVRLMILAVGVGWLVQLAGRSVEAVTGERMVVSNPGAPPWSRAGQWFGWEHGPISSKHYAHVSPMKGHWAWQRGWGPQGQQELWASDVFGFHIEADNFWAEKEGPAPLVGAAGFGENTWAKGTIAYGGVEPKWGPKHEGTHDWQMSGGHRRLSEEEKELDDAVPPPRPVVPVPVNWPAALEPELVACPSKGGDGSLVVLTAAGLGAMLPPGSADGRADGEPRPFALDGLIELGMIRSVAWNADSSSLIVISGSGRLAQCPLAQSGRMQCEALQAPALDFVAAALEVDGEILAAVAAPDGRVSTLSLRAGPNGPAWFELASVALPEGSGQPKSVSLNARYLLVSSSNGGESYVWPLHDGKPSSASPMIDTPSGGDERTWRSSCALPNGRVVRLASSWGHHHHQAANGSESQQYLAELLL